MRAAYAQLWTVLKLLRSTSCKYKLMGCSLYRKSIMEPLNTVFRIFPPVPFEQTLKMDELQSSEAQITRPSDFWSFFLCTTTMNALSDAQTLNRVSWAESSSLLDMPQNRDKLTWQLECKEEVFSGNVVVHNRWAISEWLLERCVCRFLCVCIVLMDVIIYPVLWHLDSPWRRTLHWRSRDCIARSV